MGFNMRESESRKTVEFQRKPWETLPNRREILTQAKIDTEPSAVSFCARACSNARTRHTRVVPRTSTAPTAVPWAMPFAAELMFLNVAVI